jgi:3-dehydroquinate dehydratase II
MSVTSDRPSILLVSGPNLNLFGAREPEIYGTATLDDLVGDARAAAHAHGYDLEHVQSNHEGVLLDAIHAARGRCVAIIVNPGAFGHYAYALADALAAFDGPKVELHVSNPLARESWRHTSVIAPCVTGTIQGFGRAGYHLAVVAAISQLPPRPRTAQ